MLSDDRKSLSVGSNFRGNQMIKLSQLEEAYKRTFHTATPHREVDFKTVRNLTGEKDPEVVMTMIALEEKNTGYDGLLERYLCRVGKTKLSFQVDLLPGFVKTEPPTPDAA
jgi:hypothetical protein